MSEKNADRVTPHEGGSYVRQPDGTLKLAERTQAAPPAAKGGTAAEANPASPKPASPKREEK